MKTQFLFLSFLFSLTYNVLAKSELNVSFAPIGTEWYYGYEYGPTQLNDYYHFASIRDTLIHGRLCHTIVRTHGLNICREYEPKAYLTQSNDTVFLYSPLVGIFTPLYVFNANKGDSWTISYVYGDVKVVVDSVSTISIHGASVKQQFVTYHYNWQWRDFIDKSSIISGIGDANYLFNYAIHDLPVCDDYKISKGLRCYKNPNFGTQKWTDLPCDTVFEKTTSTKTYLTDGDSWSETHMLSGYSGMRFSTWNYTIKGDTLFNSYRYKRLFVSQDSAYNPSIAFNVRFLREENGRWFYVDRFSLKEEMLYDFNLQKGDSMYSTQYGTWLRVIDVDSVLINGKFHKRLRIDKSDVSPDDWIEGLGSVQGLFYELWSSFDAGSTLLCFHSNGELIYFNPMYNSCGYSTGIDYSKIAAPLIVKTIDSSQGGFEIQCRDYIDELTVTDIRGVIVSQLHPSGNSATVSSKSFPKGVYVLRVKTEKGVLTRKIVRN